MNELGELRPSQLIFTFGVGALVDLPNLSALIMGLDDWDTRYSQEIEEDRLLAAIQKRLGGQVGKLYLPPIRQDDMDRDPAAPAVGVPVVPFPRWLRCSICQTLATVESGVFKLIQDPYRPDHTEYVHAGCLKSQGRRPPSALSVRFLLACREGHLTDFPWVAFVHRGLVPCRPATLSLREFGASGDASDIIVKCHSCNTERRMADAFEHDAQFACPGHHPHLRLVEQGCDQDAKPILLGASNSWFPTALSALSIPSATDKLGKWVEEQWAELKDTDSLDELRLLRKKQQRFQSLIPLFGAFKDEDIWAAIEAKRNEGQGEGDPAEDLKLPEWRIFSAPDSAAENRDFKLKPVAPPKGFEAFFEETVLVERIREVRALLGFTRIESNQDFAEATTLNEARLTRLCQEPPRWLPASEVRGEGIFLRIREDKLLTWLHASAVQQLQLEFFESHKAWRKLRKQTPHEEGFPGIRLILLHSLAHALMRQIVLDCGYTAASIRERLYSRQPEEAGGPMSGILLYTAAPDSEGTLGGLVELGDPLTLGRHIQQALESMRLCASDPLCAEHRPDTQGRGIQGACCHACQFAPETSCERGNRYLDRSVLVDTFSARGTAFFD
ncbi:MAG: DrmB family protein [Methylococcus sp.]